MTLISALLSRRLFRTCALAISALVPATHVFAQHVLQVTIPFPFQDGIHSFPAGQYEIQTRSDQTLVVHNLENEQIGWIVTIGEQSAVTSGPAKVVFHRYGDQYFLSDVWLANSMIGHQFIVSRAEKALRGPLVKRPAPGNQIALNVPQP